MTLPTGTGSGARRNALQPAGTGPIPAEFSGLARLADRTRFLPRTVEILTGDVGRRRYLRFFLGNGRTVMGVVYPGEEDDSRLGDFIQDIDADEPLHAAVRTMISKYLGELLDDLNERERDVIAMRYGLTDGQPRTLEEVGKRFGVTRERIRQIETRTLAKLRHPNNRSKLEDLMD